MLSKNKSLVNTNQKGSSLSLPAHGRAGARATPFFTALFAKQKTKFGGGGTPVVERFAFTTGQAGGLGQGQHLFLRRFLRSKKRNLATEKRGGKLVLS